MKRIAGAGVGILAVLGILVYVIWPAVSSAGRGDDAPIRVRNGSVYIDSGWAREPGTPPENPRRWRFQKKRTCEDADGSISPCFSREPEDHTQAPGDTDRDERLTIKITFGKGATCHVDTTTLASPVVVDGKRAIFYLNNATQTTRNFVVRRNRSGFVRFRVQVAPSNVFDLTDQGYRLEFKGVDGDYVAGIIVKGVTIQGQDGKTLECSLPHDPDFETLICSKWNRTECMVTRAGDNK